MTMRADPGTYAIVLHCRSGGEVPLGRRGHLAVDPGYYIYVGSAFGPGGVKARVSRHLRESKKRHWHIDYLREQATPVCVWCSYAPTHREHEWAQAVSGMHGNFPVTGFGCSDCGCDTHLFAMAGMPEFAQFSVAVGGAAEVWRNYAVQPEVL